MKHFKLLEDIFILDLLVEEVGVWHTQDEVELTGIDGAVLAGLVVLPAATLEWEVVGPLLESLG